MTRLAHLIDAVERQDCVRVAGRVRRVSGLVAEAEGLRLPIGSVCRLICRQDGNRAIEGEVVGFREQRILVIPCGKMQGLAPGDPVIYDGAKIRARVSESLLGRVIDAHGEPLDGRGAIPWQSSVPLDGTPIAAMQRSRITTPLSTGIRAIDALLTCGRGQRLGIFSGSGVGKSTLLSMIAKNSEAPVNIIGLIGERGREVREFVECELGPEGLARSIVVVATSDEPPVLRLRAARMATAIAEYFRDQGNDVVFMLDSITRVALAQREVGLSANEPPTTRAYPPSVFSLLARLLERTGPGAVGSITSFYTVLIEGDDLHDPIGDAVRGILDGHIWLSRDLASRSHFPAIDVLQSVSRVMNQIVDPATLDSARRVVADIARFRDVEDLLQLGAYVRGADPRTDRAIDVMPKIERLLAQGAAEQSDLDGARELLSRIYSDATFNSNEVPSKRTATTGVGALEGAS